MRLRNQTISNNLSARRIIFSPVDADSMLATCLVYLSPERPLSGNGRLRSLCMIKGSCCCGSIAFELSEPPSMIGICHCSRCRKVGASTIAFVSASSFRWLKGEGLVARYAATPPYKYDRCFCSICGTALGEPCTGETFPINANCFDNDPQVRVSFEEFKEDRPTWEMGCDGSFTAR